jgi:hypothetical protein
MIQNRTESGGKRDETSHFLALGTDRNGSKLAFNSVIMVANVPKRHNYVALNILGARAQSGNDNMIMQEIWQGR